MLDDRLLEVINKKSSNFLVTGPPGSGKTHLLVELARYLIISKKVEPSKILIFSFNRRWSKFIREKTASLIGRTIMEIPVETFYSFSTDFINKANVLIHSKYFSGASTRTDRKNTARIGDIKILNSTRQWKLLKKVIWSLGKKNYPHTSRHINGSSYIAASYMQEVFDFILRAQENLFPAKELSGRLTPYMNPVLAEMVGIYSRYMKELKDGQSYNYGMLLGESVNILKKYRHVRDHYRKKYEYILVDELQETNKAQLKIIQMISDSNCIFFGNDDEAIYAFRGSETSNFKKIYLSLGPGRILSLKENFRNSPAINGLCQKFIALAENRIKKDSISRQKDKKILNGEVVVREFSSMIDETNFICKRIKYLNSVRKLKFEDMAVIVKGLGYETHLIEDGFAENGIPFARRGSRNLLDDHYVKYIINFIRLVLAVGKKTVNKCENPDSNSGATGTRTDVHLENVLLSDILNFEPLLVKKIKNQYVLWKSKGRDLWDFIACNFYGSTKNNDIFKNDHSRGKDPGAHIEAFISATMEFSRLAHLDIFKYLMKFIKDDRIGILKDFNPEEEKDPGQGNPWSNLGVFLQNVKDFSEDNPGSNDPASFIDFLDNILENQFMEEVEESTRDLVQPGHVNIFSFHQCKGLEFKAVFIPFINDGYLPSKFSSPQAFDIGLFNYLDGEAKSEPGEMERKHLEGEVRLFYNGITRAKDFLYITADTTSRSSLFFEELGRIYNGEISKCGQEDGTAKDRESLSGEQEEYYSPDSNWKIKRKALVSTFRSGENLKIDGAGYYKQLSFLKAFYHPGTWWDPVKTTANRNNPYSLFPGQFSYSEISAYRDCPFKYKINYYFRVSREENINFTIGNLYHRVLKNFFTSGEKIFSWERLSGILKDEFENIEFEFKFLKKELKEDAIKNFSNYYKNHMPITPLNTRVEKEFSFDLAEGRIRGRIDQINAEDGGNIELVDFKSGSAAYSDKFMKEELQLKIYRLAVDLSEDLRPLRNKETKMKYVCLGNTKKTVSEMPGEHYRQDGIIQILKEVLSSIKKERFEPVPESYMSCRNCLFKILCPKYYGPEN